MPVLTDVLSEEIKELKGDVHKLAIGLAELRQEVRDAIGLAKWVGTILVATLLTSGIGAIIWGASLTTKVYGMESRGNEKFQEIGSRFDKIDGRFDRLESAIIKAIEQAKAQTISHPKAN